MARVSFTLRPSISSGLRTDVQRVLSDAVAVATDATLTSATADFTFLDEGAAIVVEGAGTAGADLETTVLSVTGPTEIEMADAAVTSVDPAVLTFVADDNDGLRADNLQLAPSVVVSPDILYLSATSDCYGEILLEWNVPLTSIGLATPEPTETVLVYSPFGPPETIPSGTVLSEGSDTFSIVHTGLPEGRFAYYSLFVRYRSVDDDYYEKVAEIYEIVPKNYGSTLAMWSRIPQYYRNLDTSIGTLDVDTGCLGFDNYGEPVGPLLRFLSIFGFEMDRSRTITSHISRAKNPEYADVESLQALAFEMGTVVDEADLGAARLRSLLYDIGTFRRTKGTIGGTEFFIRSLTGSSATVDTVAEEINVAPQRVNYILDPQNTKSVVDIETTTAGAFGEAQSPGHVEGFVSDVPAYTVSSTLVNGEFVASTPGMEGLGTETIAAVVYTNLAEADGPQTYTATSDPDVDVPSGHRFLINDDSTVAGNKFLHGFSGGTSVPLGSAAIVIGSVFSVTEATPAAAGQIVETYLSGNNDYCALYQSTDGRVYFTFQDTTPVATTLPTGFVPTPNTLYYAVGYVSPTWGNLYFKVFDSTGEVHSESITGPSFSGSWGVSFMQGARHAGATEMVHFSTGEHAEATWSYAAAIASEWLSGTRSLGGTVYTLDSPVSVVPGDILTFSVHSGAGAESIRWARLADSTTGEIYDFKAVPYYREGVPYFDVVSTVTATVNVEYMVDGSVPFTNAFYLLEKNTVGPYFDGSLVRGGWLTGDSSSVADYRWEGGGAFAHNARSLYSEDYERTRQIVTGLFQDVLPVDVAANYTINFNVVA